MGEKKVSGVLHPASVVDRRRLRVVPTSQSMWNQGSLSDLGGEGSCHLLTTVHGHNHGLTCRL